MTADRASRAPDGWALAVGMHGLAVILAVTPTVLVFAPLASAPLFVAAALAALPAAVRGGLRWPGRTVMLPLLALHLWQAISLAWCPDLWQGTRTTFAMSALSAGGLLLLALVGTAPPPLVRKGVAAAGWGVLAGAVVFVVESVWGAAIRDAVLSVLTGHDVTVSLFEPRLKRPMTIISLLFTPVAFWLLLRRRWGMLAALTATMAVAVTVSTSSVSKVCLVVGPAVLALSWLAAAPMVWLIRIAVSAALVAMPLVFIALPEPQTVWNAVPPLPSSAHHRITIWQFTAHKVFEKPLFGWGIDSARNIPGAEEERIYISPRTGSAYTEQLLPLHPHNTSMQIWLELGAVGIAIMIALILGVMARLNARHRDARALGLGTTALVITVAAISFGAWQSWWIAMVWLVAALQAAMARDLADTRQNEGRPG